MAFYNNITARFALKESRRIIAAIAKKGVEPISNYTETWHLDNGRTLKVWVTSDRRRVPDTYTAPGYWITTHRIAYQYEEPKARVYFEGIQ